MLGKQHARSRLLSAEVVRLRKAAYERVENQLGTADTSILPRCYGNVNREQAYEAGLEEGTVAFLDGLKYEHDFFLEVTPRGILVNARFVQTPVVTP